MFKTIRFSRSGRWKLLRAMALVVSYQVRLYAHAFGSRTHAGPLHPVIPAEAGIHE